VQVHQDSTLECCLVSESSATTLLGECKPEPVDLQIVSGNGGRVFNCSQKFEARWCYKGEPYTQPVTLFIAPGLRDGAIFPESLISGISSSGAPLAPVGFRPKNQTHKEKDVKREAEAKKVNEDTIKKIQDKKKEDFGNAGKRRT